VIPTTKHQKRLSVPEVLAGRAKDRDLHGKGRCRPARRGRRAARRPPAGRARLRGLAQGSALRTSEDSILINGSRSTTNSARSACSTSSRALAFEEYHRVFPDEGGRLALTAIDEDAAGSRLGKIEGKQQVPGGDTQLTLHDGTNVLTDSDEYRPKDSIVIDNDDKSVVAHFPYEEGALRRPSVANHGGKVGEIDAIDITPGSGSNNVGVSMDDGGF